MTTAPGPDPLRIAMHLVRMTRGCIAGGHEHLETLPRAALQDPRVHDTWRRVMNHLAAARLGLAELLDELDELAALAHHHAGEDAAEPEPGPEPAPEPEDAP